MLHQDDATAGSEHLIDELIHKLLPIVAVEDTWQAPLQKKDPLFQCICNFLGCFSHKRKSKVEFEPLTH